ncbi:MAG: bifunctional phosphoribosylaminoimidazolecarboxamide formyltransferase/IMP cyclohydrolase [Candidatus Muiribacteriota bacterium]
MIRNALISVWDKTGLEKLAKELENKSVNIIATGSTAEFLRKNNIACTEVADLTGFPEILNGRVKTLHPKIFGGILYKRDKQEHIEEINNHHIPSIDLVVCNLYPFEEALWKNLSEDELVEYIDIGGVTLLRASAKAGIPVLSDKSQYDEFIKYFSENEFEIEYIKKLRAKTFSVTCAYDFAISNYFGKNSEPANIDMSFAPVAKLRYGENPHQSAQVYKNSLAPFCLTDSKILQGKQMSYNNFLDMEAAVSTVKDFNNSSVCAIFKHGNPCGLSAGNSAFDNYINALSGDSLSAFGGIVCMNRRIDEKLALKITEHFFEIIIAPEFSEEALGVFKKKKNLRVVQYNNFESKERYTFFAVEGGILRQEKDWYEDLTSNFVTVTQNKPSEQDIKELDFAFRVVKNIKSNAIAITRGKTLLGMGAGQPSRVDSVEIAVKKAGEKSAEAYLASDAFFPFADALEKACEAGIKFVIQPGGSINDEEVIKKADELGIVMVFTGRRHFRH